MCLICTHVVREKMTIKEIKHASLEYAVPEDHIAELLLTVADKFGYDNADFEELVNTLYKLDNGVA